MVILLRTLGWVLGFLLFASAANARSGASGESKARLASLGFRSTPNAVAAAPRPPRAPSPSAATNTPVSLRFLVGFNFSYGTSIPEKPGSTRNAPSLLLSVDLPVGNGWSACPGLGLLARGVQTTVYTVGSVDLKGDVHLNYLELPLLLKKSFAAGSRGLRMTVFGGPAIALAIQRSVQLLGTVDWDISNRFFGSDALIYVGTGLEYPTKSGLGLLAELRYAIGIGDIDRTASEYRTRGILLLLGVSF